MMVTETLINQVRRKLNITWHDTETDARVAEIIESAIPYLLHKLGITELEFDFSVPGTENDLLKSLCLYEWNHVSRDEFEANYHCTIANVRARYEVKYYQEAIADEQAEV
jgi:hypothetical protein